MKEMLAQIFHQFNNPDVSSSAVPLILIIVTMLCGALLVVAKLFSKLRWTFPKRKSNVTTPKLSSPPIHFRHWFAKLKKPKISFPRWNFRLRRKAKVDVSVAARPVVETITNQDLPRAKSTEVEQLRALVRKLEEANAIERELNAKSLRKVTELQSELQALFLKWQEEQKLLEFERTRRTVLEERIFQLEKQIQAAIQETETIFEKSSALPSPSIPEGLDSDEPMIALPDPEIEKQKKEKVSREIDEMIKEMPDTIDEAISVKGYSIPGGAAAPLDNVSGVGKGLTSPDGETPAVEIQPVSAVENSIGSPTAVEAHNLPKDIVEEKSLNEAKNSEDFPKKKAS